ncbi:DUF1772 domain-containing protein [Legionella brunensis]|uniref:DUF1772 domain-containing protein n=1 Tax=Legionella brunensis TaxID=29422 RepID=UPI002378AA61|nr:DUF1772 domain-containing protein [Legionella brunensis]
MLHGNRRTFFSYFTYTLLSILPTNQKIMATDEMAANEQTRNLIKQWGKLHAIRSLLGCVATLFFLLGSLD